jgi:hypothetical protein
LYQGYLGALNLTGVEYIVSSPPKTLLPYTTIQFGANGSHINITSNGEVVTIPDASQVSGGLVNMCLQDFIGIKRFDSIVVGDHTNSISYGSLLSYSGGNALVNHGQTWLLNGIMVYDYTNTKKLFAGQSGPLLDSGGHACTVGGSAVSVINGVVVAGEFYDQPPITDNPSQIMVYPLGGSNNVQEDDTTPFSTYNFNVILAPGLLVVDVATLPGSSEIPSSVTVSVFYDFSANLNNDWTIGNSVTGVISRWSAIVPGTEPVTPLSVISIQYPSPAPPSQALAFEIYGLLGNVLDGSPNTQIGSDTEPNFGINSDPTNIFTASTAAILLSNDVDNWVWVDGIMTQIQAQIVSGYSLVQGYYTFIETLGPFLNPNVVLSCTPENPMQWAGGIDNRK